MTNDVDVVIVGSGPVGMVLAALLGTRGVSTLVLEKETDVFRLPRAAHIDHTGLRTLQEIGCVDALLPTMIPNSGLLLTDELLQPLARISGNQRSISGLPASMYFYQPDFDRALDQHLATFPSVTVRRGCEVVSLTQHDGGAEVVYVDGTGDRIAVGAGWVVGCDGSRSIVRESMDVVLESLDFDERWLVLDLVRRSDTPVPDYAIQVCDPNRPWVANPMPGSHYRMEMRLFDDEGETEAEALGTPEYVSEHLRPLLGEVEFGIERRAIYTFHGLVSSRWRDGRFLLAGDAAHQMPPFLGQGMCSGIRDASNLAWKLAAVIEGRLQARMLDSYEQERSPHVRRIVAAAVEFGRFVSEIDATAVAERNRLLRESAVTSALSFTLPPLETSPLLGAGGGMLFPQPPGIRPRLDDVLGDGVVIVARTSDVVGEDAPWWEDRFGARVVTFAELGENGDKLVPWYDRQGIDVAVVRPDRYVMAAGRTLSTLRAALESSELDTATIGGP